MKRGRFSLRSSTDSASPAPTSNYRRPSIFGPTDAIETTVPESVDEYSITLPCRLSDFKPNLRRSMPSIPSRHMSASSTGSRRGTDSTSENGSTYTIRGVSSRMSTSSSSQSANGVVETNHIHIYLPKRGSNDSGSVSVATKTPDEETPATVDPVPSADEDLFSETLSRLKSHYIGEIVFQVNEYVYCGGIEANLNHNLLCRLKIGVLIDVSGPEAEALIRSRPEVPCLCGFSPHSRTTLSIRIRDDTSERYRTPTPQTRDGVNQGQTRPATSSSASVGVDDNVDLTLFFEEAITHIERAKKAKKAALIFSVKCRNRAPAFAAAYLMHAEGLTWTQAIQRVEQIINGQLKTSRVRPGVQISDALLRALRRWQTKLAKQRESNQKDVDRLFSVRKNWS